MSRCLKADTSHVDICWVELNACPACDAFTRREWTHCQACRAELPVFTEPTREDESYVQIDAPPVEPRSSLIADEPASPRQEPTSNDHDETKSGRTESNHRVESGPTSFIENSRHVLSGIGISNRRALVVTAVCLGGGLLVLILTLTTLVSSNRDARRDAGSMNSAPTATTDQLRSSDHWISYADPDGHFTVDLPSIPEPIDQTINSTVARSWRSESPDSETSVVVSAFRLDQAPNTNTVDKVLLDAIRSTEAITGAKAKNPVLTNQNGRRHIDAHLAGDNSVHDVRSFVDGDMLYVLRLSTSNEDGDPETYSRVSQTFKPSVTNT